MAFRRQPSNPNPYPFANPPPHQSPASAPASAPAQQQQQPDASPPHDSAQSRKRPRAASDVGDPAQQDPFHHENGSDASDASDDGGGKPDKKAGRRKIKIEFIQDKSRRHITFSKRKAGIMKKAYELSTLTGTQVLLLVVSETGLVYTFTTAKLQPLVTQPEGKNLIQACLNAPHSSMPSLPVGSPIGRNHPSSSAGITAPQAPPQSRNVPGGLAIGGDKDQVSPDHPSSAGGASADHSGDHPDRSSDDPHSPRVATRRPSNAPPPSNKDSPPRKPSSSSPSLLPLQYPSAYAGLALDPGMYGHHAQQPPPPPPQYLPQQQTAQQQGPQGAGYMGGAQWQPGQAGYARR